MAQKKACLEIAEKYANFRKVEDVWRTHFKNAMKDKDSRQVAHFGMKEVREAFEIVENVLSCSYEKAQEIMGEDFFGKEDLETAFGFKTNVEIPRIKFTAEQLKKAQEHGEMLVLRIGQDNEGNPMTMKRILEIMAARMPEKEKLLYDQKKANEPALKDDCWFKDEDKEPFIKAGLKTEWVLVGKEFAPNTINMNYARQTLELYKIMKERKLMTLEEEKENTGLENKLKQLCRKNGVNWETQNIDNRAKYDKNWAAVARELADLPINRKHRRSASGIVFDWAVRFKSRKGERGQLGALYDWSNSVSSAGSLVYLGPFGSNGGTVAGSIPAGRLGELGAVLLRGSSS